MNLLALILALVFSGATAGAQVGPNPGTWLLLPGDYSRNASVEDVTLLALLQRARMLEMQREKTWKAEWNQLASTTQEVLSKGVVNISWRFLTRLLWLMNGGLPGEESELLATMNFLPDARVLPADDILHVGVLPMFGAGKRLQKTYTFRATLADGGGKVVATSQPVVIDAIEERELSIPLGKLPAGGYTVRCELTPAEGKEPLSAVTREILICPDCKTRISRLSERMQRAQITTPRQRAAMETLEYLRARLQAGLQGYVGAPSELWHPAVARFAGTMWLRESRTSDYERHLAQAEKLAELLEKGEDPWQTMRGHMTLAYLATDNTYQPYDVYIPQKLSPKMPVVALIHAGGGDFSSPFVTALDDKGVPLAAKLAEEHGFVVVSPFGRGSFGVQVDLAEADFYVTLDKVALICDAEVSRAYVFGYWTGGVGTLNMALRQSNRFAAIALAAGVPGPRGVAFDKLGDVALQVFAAGKDRFSAAQNAKMLALSAERAKRRAVLVELPDADAFSVYPVALKPAFEFFAKVRKDIAAAEAAKPKPADAPKAPETAKQR